MCMIDKIALVIMRVPYRHIGNFARKINDIHDLEISQGVRLAMNIINCCGRLIKLTAHFINE